jgi:hypothetical protein
MIRLKRALLGSLDGWAQWGLWEASRAPIIVDMLKADVDARGVARLDKRLEPPDFVG